MQIFLISKKLWVKKLLKQAVIFDRNKIDQVWETCGIKNSGVSNENSKT